MSLQFMTKFGSRLCTRAVVKPISPIQHSQGFFALQSNRWSSDTSHSRLESAEDADDHGKKSSKKAEVVSSRVKKVLERRKFRFAFPEFLPDPDPLFRNPLVEFLQRKDMLDRREKVNIPEFYVGSTVAVTMSDPNAPTDSKTTTFTGIVIDRGGTGLRAWFVLRNIIDHQGIEISYRMYSPNILSIETLKLERRLDDELYYLRYVSYK